MSLNGAIQIGRSGLAASQAALQVAGNNMANAATPGYHRRSVHLTPATEEVVGRNARIGQGVQLLEVRREVDTALQSRLRDAISQQHGASIDQRFLSALETIQNELTENDLSSLLSTFFNGFSEMANTPEDNAVRSVVVQQGLALADRVGQLRADYSVVVEEIDTTLGTSVEKVNDLMEQISAVNVQIAQTEGGGAVQANSLRDHRDVLLDELAQFMDITAIEQANGSVDVLVGSIPVILAGESRGVDLRKQSVGDQVVVSLRVATDGTDLDVGSGRLGALINQRDETVQPAIDAIDEFARQLIFQVNRVHSQGQGRTGFDSVTGTYPVDDSTANLNAEASGLPFKIENGSFFIHVTHTDTGAQTSHRIDVDGNAMSLDDLINEINVAVGVPNVTASESIERTLSLDASAGYEISFSEDSSGALAALGINTFFVGDGAQSIDINQTVQDDPGLIAARAGHVPGSNDTAVLIAGLRNVKLADLGDKSLRDIWQESVNDLAVRTDAARANVQATGLVRDSLTSQMQAVSGVSLDEETINLMQFQRQFQAAARFIAVIDEALQVLLSIV